MSKIAAEIEQNLDETSVYWRTRIMRNPPIKFMTRAMFRVVFGWSITEFNFERQGKKWKIRFAVSRIRRRIWFKDSATGREWYAAGYDRLGILDSIRLAWWWLLSKNGGITV